MTFWMLGDNAWMTRMVNGEWWLFQGGTTVAPANVVKLDKTARAALHALLSEEDS